VVGKLDFGVTPGKAKAISQLGIFIHGVSASAPNKDNAIKFCKWFAQDRIQIELARSGDLPVKRAGFEDPQAVAAHRLLPVALAQLDSGCTPRPRTPDWSEAELIIGTALNEALVKGTDGSAELDQAAKDVRAKFNSLGYYG
jgi:multiple sugar transport system substrate-binding protein